jgi:D-hydroxyproline dehydrogenase subunit alpha
MTYELIPIDFEGQTILLRRGESLASGLTAHGIQVLRTTRTGAERGVFCGMGVCQDCLVAVDGHANERACLVKVDRQMRVRRESYDRPVPAVNGSEPPQTIDSIPVERPDVLVVGAGPGGLSAALAAQRAGAKVLLLDEASAPGGQYYKQRAVDELPLPDSQHRAGKRLIKAVLRSGVEIRSSTVVWGAFAPREFAATVEGRTLRIQPGAAIIATGAYDRGWAVPGWTLPGVITTGAAQTMWRMMRRLPSRRVCIAGNGPLNLQLAAELIRGGAEIVALIEAGEPFHSRNTAHVASMLATAPRLALKGMGYLARLRREKVRIISGCAISSIERSGAGLRATFTGLEQGSIEAGTICLGYGFHPSNELLRALGCAHRWDADRSQLVTVIDPSGETTVAGVWALGDCTGLNGARVALADGTIAGCAAAARLGFALPANVLVMRGRAFANAVRHRRFQRALWSAYAMSPSLGPVHTPETIICRCEELTYAEMDRAIDGGATTLRDLKRETRIGMGRCQGRYCAHALEELLAERTGQAPDEYSAFAPRVPVRPIAVSAIARPAK